MKTQNYHGCHQFVICQEHHLVNDQNIALIFQTHLVKLLSYTKNTQTIIFFPLPLFMLYSKSAFIRYFKDTLTCGCQCESKPVPTDVEALYTCIVGTLVSLMT